MTTFPPADLSNAQLFLDDRWVALSCNVRRQWHVPRRMPEPVIKADHRWEQYCPVMYGSVLRRDGVFHAWYPGWTRNPQPLVCYARSEDGIHWTKPALGLCEVFGSKDNNVLMRSAHPDGLIDNLTVVEDPDDPQWPLKMFYWDGGWDTPEQKEMSGIYMASSKDGIHWENRRRVIPGCGDRFNALPVKHQGQFVILLRGSHRKYQQGRIAACTRSRDGVEWSPAQWALAADAEDPPFMEVYSIVPFAYAGLILGGIERMHKSPDKLDTEIAWSDDGCQWSRSRTRPSFIPFGTENRWDDTWINLSASQPIRMGNELWFYYSGRHGAHGVAEPHNYGGIGLATLRLDGFCSLGAGHLRGFIQTPVFTWPGGELQVNADCRADLSSHPKLYSGTGVHVEVRDDTGKPIEGFELDQSQPFLENSIHQPEGYATMSWKSGAKLAGLAGRPIQLWFTLQNAHLYAFKSDGKA